MTTPTFGEFLRPPLARWNLLFTACSLIDRRPRVRVSMSFFAILSRASLSITLLAGMAAAQTRPSAVQLVDPQAAARKPRPAGTGLLPAEFSGWQKTTSSASKDAAQADPANSDLMKEYGFTDFEQATYTHDGRKLQVHAARFADAGGAYGAFTFYKQPDMLVERIGDQGGSLNNLILFYRGNVLVRVELKPMTAMSASELRELAADLPPTPPSVGNLPSLPTYLPRQGYRKNSARYVVGPIGLSRIGSPLPASVIDFGRGAEVALGKYDGAAGAADLLLISYPTPQMAGERARALEALIKQNMSQQSTTQAGAGQAPVQAVRRSGPLVAFASGNLTSSEARSLIAAVNYDANVTWNEPTFLGKRNNIGNLMVAALMLCGIILLLALAAGVAFGGVRILVKRFFPGRVFDRATDMEIIRLKLSD